MRGILRYAVRILTTQSLIACDDQCGRRGFVVERLPVSVLESRNGGDHQPAVVSVDRQGSEVFRGWIADCTRADPKGDLAIGTVREEELSAGRHLLGWSGTV